MHADVRGAAAWRAMAWQSCCRVIWMDVSAPRTRQLSHAQSAAACKPLGHDCAGHKYIGHNYIGHNFIDRDYIGRNYIEQ